MDNVVDINKAEDKAVAALISDTVDLANDILQQINQK